jgi:hypothetical protein
LDRIWGSQRPGGGALLLRWPECRAASDSLSISVIRSAAPSASSSQLFSSPGRPWWRGGLAERAAPLPLWRWSGLSASWVPWCGTRWSAPVGLRYDRSAGWRAPHKVPRSRIFGVKFCCSCAFLGRPWWRGRRRGGLSACSTLPLAGRGGEGGFEWKR